MATIKVLPDGTTIEIFTTQAEYLSRLYELQKIMGRNKLFYHGWLNGELVINYR